MFLSARPPELVRYWGRGAASLFLLGLLALRPGLALGFADEAARRAEIERTWAGSRQEIEAFVNDPDNRAAGEGRYYLQMWTNDLVRYAISKRIVAIRDPLLALYDKEFDTLTHATDYVFAYDPRAFGVSRARLALAQPADLWVSPNGEELVLSSSQFVWHLASVSRALIEANQASEPVVRPFLARALAVVTAHLKRWALSDKDRIFQRRGYGSQYGMYNHREFVQQLRLRAFSGASYSNAITDIDTWIIAAAAELIAAHRLLPGVAPLDNAAATALAVYVREATAMLSERSQSQSLYKPDGTPVSGLVFDPGGFDGHPDHRFAGYSGAEFPTAEKAGPSGASWDSSHGGRQPSVFPSLYETRGATGAAWPDAGAIAAFARSFAFAVFEGDLKRPRLRNFLDGSNGWYRADLAKHLGYPPFGLTCALLYMPWGRYAAFEPAIAPIVAAAWRIVASDDPQDVAFRNRMFETPRENGGSGVPDASVRGASQWLFPLLAAYPLDPASPSVSK
jgi:hypothetical protein